MQEVCSKNTAQGKLGLYQQMYLRNIDSSRLYPHVFLKLIEGNVDLIAKAKSKAAVYNTEKPLSAVPNNKSVTARHRFVIESYGWQPRTG